MTYTTYEQSVADGQPVELYRFAQGISRWLYTSGQAPVDYLSETYQPLTLARGAIEQANEIHRNGIEITLPRDCPVATLFIAAPLLAWSLLQELTAAWRRTSPPPGP